MKQAFDHLILIGRPASGKSEFIDYMKKDVSDSERLEKFHIAPFEELDDFLWLWQICHDDDIWEELGCPRVVSKKSGHGHMITKPAFWNFLIKKFNHTVATKYAPNADFYNNKTLFIEFSRGTDKGYSEAFSHMSKDVLKRSAILYVNVSFKESLRRNEARYQEKLKHSVLAHKTPDEQMNEYYNVDDWAKITHEKPDGFLELHGVRVPFVTMNNEPESKDVKVLEGRYKAALDKLFEHYTTSR